MSRRAGENRPLPPAEEPTVWEPERYELATLPAARLSRRELLRALGGGVLLLLVVGETATPQESGGGRGRGRGAAAPREIGAWLHIGPEGAVTVFTGKAEVGQNIRTSLAQAVAEELRLSPEQVRLVMADTDRVPFDMGTFGSRTTPQMSLQLRRAAAAAREVLLDFAAARWDVERSGLTVADGRIAGPEGRSVSFGELTRGQRLVREIPADVSLAPPAGWRVAGRSVPKIEGRAFVTGAHRYASDIVRPGMLYGRVLRPERWGARLVSADTRAAEAIPGVRVVREGEFVGVVAPSEHLAARALAAIRAEWRDDSDAAGGTGARPSSSTLFDLLRRTAEGAPPADRPADPAVARALAAAPHTLAAVYTIAPIAHAPLEPRAAVAEWREGRLTVWTGTQRPFGVRSELAAAFGLPEERVRVVVPDTGSGYGGKHTGEAAVEAARLARAVGRPVRLLWSREDEFAWAYFRPPGVIEVRAGATAEGNLLAWEFHNINSGASGLRSPYEIPHRHEAFHPARSPLRQGSYRALAATANHFARECHMDDLALAVGQDPLEFRLRNLREPRLRAVLEAAAKRFGWSERRGEAARRETPGRGVGLACGVEKGGYIATAAEVGIESDGRVRVLRLTAAFECGAVVHPDHLRSQVEGALVMGLGGALFEAIRFEDGRLVNGRFSRYRVPRFSDLSEVDVVLLDRKDLPSAGAGETPIVAVAPAVGNAVRDACGVRLRSLPLAPDGLRV